MAPVFYERWGAQYIRQWELTYQDENWYFGVAGLVRSL